MKARQRGGKNADDSQQSEKRLLRKKKEGEEKSEEQGPVRPAAWSENERGRERESEKHMARDTRRRRERLCNSK